MGAVRELPGCRTGWLHLGGGGGGGRGQEMRSAAGSGLHQAVEAYRRASYKRIDSWELQPPSAGIQARLSSAKLVVNRAFDL